MGGGGGVGGEKWGKRKAENSTSDFSLHVRKGSCVQTITQTKLFVSRYDENGYMNICYMNSIGQTLWGR